jgi:hypothetical protein
MNIVKADLNNTYLGEYVEYNRLFLLGSSRTSTGNPTFTSTSSSQTYTVSDNGGENSMLGLLQTALNSYMITASYINSITNGTYNYITTTNVSNAYAATPTTNLVSYNEHLTFNVRFNASNTGASTINIDSLGIKSLKKQTIVGKIALATGDIIANNMYTIVYDGTDFILVNPSNILTFDGAYKTLLTNSTNNNITWGESLQSLMTAQGMITYAATPNTPTMLTKGTSYQGLRMNSGETAPEWGNVMLGEKQIFTSSGTFTAPKTGIYKVTVAGGGGSAATSASGYYCGGGGSGGTAIKYVTLTKDDAITVTVGDGGLAPTGSVNQNGNAGGTSSFGSSCSGIGGSGGTYSNGGIGEGGTGGNGSSGDINIQGISGGFMHSIYGVGTFYYNPRTSTTGYGIGAPTSSGSNGYKGVVIVEW